MQACNKLERVAMDSDSQVANSSLDRGTSGKDAVILQDQHAVLVAECIGNVVSLLFSEHNATEVLVQSALAVQCTAVLCCDLDCMIVSFRRKRNCINT